MNRKPFKNFYFFDWLWFKSGSQRKRNNIATHFRSLLIGKKDKFYLKLFGKKAIAKGNLKPFESTEILTCKKKTVEFF